MTSDVRIIERRHLLTTPRAAAVAGILSGVLFIASHLLLGFTLSTEVIGSGTNLAENAGMLSLTVRLVPFAGIAFLWFIGVARDRLGRREDQFFSTVFFGSGLLYLAMTFIASAIAGGLLGSYLRLEPALSEAFITFTASMASQIVAVFGVRMAAVFMISAATMWYRTEVMPRPLALLTYVLGLGLLVLVNYSFWVTLVFPVWILGVSTLILILNYRRPSEKRIEPLMNEPEDQVS